jgi:hypothetical protein
MEKNQERKLPNPVVGYHSIDDAIRNLKEKKIRFVFYVYDTQGKVFASMIHIYDIALRLSIDGYDVIMVHDKEYTNKKWLSPNHCTLKHVVQGGNEGKIELTASDFLVLSEDHAALIYQNFQEQNVKLPCEVIIINNNPMLALHTLPHGLTWPMMGYRMVINNSQNTADYTSKLMQGMLHTVVNPKINPVFESIKNYRKPLITIYSRNPQDIEIIPKEFYLYNPHLSFFSIRIIKHDMSQKELANVLSQSALFVWIDENSSFGTLPVEAAFARTPTLALIPYSVPEWADKLPNIRWVESKRDMARVMGEMLTDFLNNVESPQMPDDAYMYGDASFTEQLQKAIDTFIAARLEFLEKLTNKEND